jgi:uncharacterized protein (UPF0276 family)
MIGVGYRREMHAWNMASLPIDFVEVVAENWLRRDRALLHQLMAQDLSVRLHGVSLNLGGRSVLRNDFLDSVKALMAELQTPYYSDHLAASGDAHQLYDLFPIALTEAEVIRVSDRIQAVQERLGCRIAVENTTWYTNHGRLEEAEFISAVIQRADCQLLLDLNNVVVNHKNHGLHSLTDFVERIDMSRVSYLHVAGHEYDERFGMYIDTHSQPVQVETARMARQLQQSHGLDVLMEWDNDVPTQAVLHQELACLRPFSTT